MSLDSFENLLKVFSYWALRACKLLRYYFLEASCASFCSDVRQPYFDHYASYSLNSSLDPREFWVANDLEKNAVAHLKILSHYLPTHTEQHDT